MTYDDLLGTDTEAEDDPSLLMQDVHLVTNQGVSVQWLATVFGMRPEKVRSALAACPVWQTRKTGGKLYELRVAARYLVEPVGDLKEYLRNIDSKTLPERLQGWFWEAKIKEMRARVMAGDLWPTSAVLDVLGDTFLTIKSTAQLWADTIEESSKGLTPELRDEIVALSDALLDQVHKSLVVKAESSATKSWLKDLDDDAD